MRLEKSNLSYLLIQYKEQLSKRLYRINKTEISRFIYKNEIEYLINEINSVYHALVVLDNVDLIRKYN